MPARPVRGPASRRAVRRAHEVDGLGPRPRLAAHGLAGRARGEAAVGVRQLGQLRRRSGRPEQRERAGQPHCRPQGALRRLGPGDNAGRRPQLGLKHTLLPHVPWQFLPDAKLYKGGDDPIPGLSNESYNDATQVESLYQRHLLQLGFADRELGELLRHLKREGPVRQVADRGHRRPRRRLRRRRARPPDHHPRERRADRFDPAVHQGARAAGGNGQRRVRRDGRHPSHDLRRARRPPAGARWTGGPPSRPRFSAGAASASSQRRTFKPLRFTAAEWERGKAAALERKLRLFGVGSDGPLRLFRSARIRSCSRGRCGASPSSSRKARISWTRGVRPGGPALVDRSVMGDGLLGRRAAGP